MDAHLEKSAWQPFTPSGVAAFARAGWQRLLLLQTVCALLAAAAMVWFLHQGWFPVIQRAIAQLPPQGEIRLGTLDWRGDSLVPLAENRFLSFTVDLNHSGGARSPAHVQVEFGHAGAKVLSLFGFLRCSYPRHWRVAFNHAELEPWWGAWAPPILSIAAASVVVGLFLSWMLLATVYFLPAWLIGWFANRDLSLSGSWRACGAALMPGALFLTFAILLYGCGLLDLLRLTAALAAHFIITWFFVVAAPLAAPRRPGRLQEDNPFARPAPPSPTSAEDDRSDNLSDH